MAQKPIGYYGKFTPTGVDQSAGRRFEALAGLAGQVGDIATAFGKKKVSEQAFLKEKNDIVAAEKAAMLAGDASAVSGTPLELRKLNDINDYEQNKVYNATAQTAYAAGIQNEITSIVSSAATEYPGDIEAYRSRTSSSMNGLLSVAPEEMRPAFESYFNQVNQTAASNIWKAQQKKQKDIDSATIETALVDQTVNLVNLARSDNIEELRNAALIWVETGRRAMDNGLVSRSVFANQTVELRDRLATQSALGRFDLIIRNEKQTVEQRIASGQNVINQINERDTFQVEDPFDPEKMITLDADEKDALVKDLENELKDFESEEIKKAESKIQASRFQQISNYSAAIETVQDVSISDDNKLLAIAEAEMNGQIGKEEAVLLRRYVTSAKALNAITNSEVMGDILTRAYDLNANFDYDVNSNDYLEGVNNLREDILLAVSRGDLTSDDELKLSNQLKTLTAAKIAGATSEIAGNNSKVNQTIRDSLPPDLRGVAIRALFDAVYSRKQEIEDEGRTVTRKEEIKLWSDLAPSVVADIREKRRAKSIERVNNILAISTVTNQAEFDALPFGTTYLENGVRYTKEAPTPNLLFENIMAGVTRASLEEETKLFETHDYFGEVKNGKAYVNEARLREEGSTGDFVGDMLFGEALHELRNTAPEWHSRLQEAADNDPVLQGWKLESYNYLTGETPDENGNYVPEGQIEERPIDKWWDESRFDQVVGGFLLGGPNANVSTMRDWDRSKLPFGTGFRKELENFEKALGRTPPTQQQNKNP